MLKQLRGSLPAKHFFMELALRNTKSGWLFEDKGRRHGLDVRLLEAPMVTQNTTG